MLSGRLCSELEVIIIVQGASGTGLWEWPLGLGVDSWEEPQRQWRQISLWLLVANCMRALVTGGIKVFAAKACSIYQKCSRIGEEASQRPTGPLSSPRPTLRLRKSPPAFVLSAVMDIGGRGISGILCLQQQDYWSTPPSSWGIWMCALLWASRRLEFSTSILC